MDLSLPDAADIWRGSVPELPTGTVTFLFSDIEGSTRLLEATGTEFATLLARHHEILRGCWREHRGAEVSTEGDAFFVAFPDPVDAVCAAACAQRRLAAESWRAPFPVRVRIGIHTGRGVRGGDNYVGMDVHRAARIAGAGHGGQVLISETTRQLVERAIPDGMSIDDLGAHRLRDLPQPEHIAQLVVEGLPRAFPPIRSIDARPTNLPQVLTPLLGREAEVERIRTQLSEHRLVTLTGPGGIGKTRLALAVAEGVRDRFPDGVFVAWLASLNDPARLASAIGGPLGVQESGDRPAREVLVDNLREREVLVVLDNFEHLMSEAGYVAELLAASPGLRLIVTSQQMLRLSGEQVHEVVPLRLPEAAAPPDEVLGTPAVALFEQRVRAFKPDFRIRDEDVATIGDIVAALDGVPLAIELAAARIRVLSPRAILARLNQRLALLTGGGADRPARHQTLRAALDWSYDLLAGPSRDMLTRLSVFRGGFDFAAAEAVAALEPALDAPDELAALVDHSLVRTDDVAGEPRFSLLELIREYAAERLVEAGRAERAAAAHARVYREIAADLGRNITRTDGAVHLDRLEREHDNLRAALQWHVDSRSTDEALDMVASLWRFWHLRGHILEGRQWAAAALDAVRGANPAAVSRALVADGSLAYWQADFPSATERYVAALAYARRSADDRAIGEALFNLAMMRTSAGRLDEALDLIDEGDGLFARLGDDHARGRLLFARMYAVGMAGRLVEAQAFVEEARAIFERVGDLYWEGTSYHGLGQCLRLGGRAAESEQPYCAALTRLARLIDRSGVGVELDMLAVVAAELGEDVRALRLAGAAAAIRDAIGAGQLLEMQLYRDPVEMLEGRVSDSEAADALAEGRSWSMAAAVAYAVRANSESEVLAGAA